MKRLHVHVAVDDLQQSIRFYSTLFATEPSVTKSDYAKWMLAEPRVNFAISARGRDHAGLDHLGIQVEDATELAEVYDRLKVAEGPVLEESNTTCCYAQSEKSWITDPSGIAWETFLTHGESTVYGTSAPLNEIRTTAPKAASGCGCGPSVGEPAKAKTEAACCG